MTMTIEITTGKMARLAVALPVMIFQLVIPLVVIPLVVIPSPATPAAVRVREI